MLRPDVPGKRSVPVRSAALEQRLVVSNMTEHSAGALCSSVTSWGPDFVGPDGRFCDMGTKTLHEPCSHDTAADCMYIDTETRTVSPRSLAAGRGRNIVRSMPFKSYETVSIWS